MAYRCLPLVRLAVGGRMILAAPANVYDSVVLLRMIREMATNPEKGGRMVRHGTSFGIAGLLTATLIAYVAVYHFEYQFARSRPASAPGSSFFQLWIFALLAMLAATTAYAIFFGVQGELNGWHRALPSWRSTVAGLAYPVLFVAAVLTAPPAALLWVVAGPLMLPIFAAWLAHPLRPH